MTKEFLKYPGINLQDAENALQELKREMGLGPYSRQAIAQGLGYKGISGASSKRIGALVHYGLLEKNGEDYKLSDLGRRVVLPTSDEAKSDALREAALNPRLFKGVYQQYKGSELPLRLGNILVQNYSVFHTSGEEAAKNFKTTMEYAGFMSEGKLTDVANSSSDELMGTKSVAAAPETPTLQKPPISKTDNFSIELPSGIVLQIPNKLSYQFARGEFADAVNGLEEVANKYVDIN